MVREDFRTIKTEDNRVIETTREMIYRTGNRSAKCNIPQVIARETTTLVEPFATKRNGLDDGSFMSTR